MATLSLAGRVPFRVTLDPTPGNLTRFVRAMIIADARVARSKMGRLLWTTWVWLEPTKISRFEQFCSPHKFELISADEVGLDGVPTDRSPR